MYGGLIGLLIGLEIFDFDRIWMPVISGALFGSLMICAPYLLPLSLLKRKSLSTLIAGAIAGVVSMGFLALLGPKDSWLAYFLTGLILGPIVNILILSSSNE